MQFNVADLVERVAHNVPDREAVICGEQRATYRHFDEKSAHFARYLLSVGLGKGDHIAIYAYNSIEWIEAMLACYKIGAVPININFRYVEDELNYIFDNADIRMVIYDAEFSGRITHVRDHLPLLQHFVCFDHWGDLADYPTVAGSESFSVASACEAEVEFPERSGDDLYLLYTGGTTGMPKGVVWSQHDVVLTFGGGIDVVSGEMIESPEAMADRCIQEGAFAMRSLQMAPLMHGAAQWGILRALFEGATVVLLASKHFDAHEAWRLVEEEQINVLLVTGDAMAKPMMTALEEGRDGQAYNTSTLFAFASTSAIFSPSLKDQYAERLPNVVITDNTGSSESGYTGMTIHEKGKAETNAGGPRVSPASGVVVLDEDFNLIPPGDDRVGLMAKGGLVPLAYYKDEEKSAKTFVTAGDGKRYALPGDMARHNADGTITMLGRGSQCINTGGEKVYPEEVEMAIKAHPDVLDCLVAGTPDERFGSSVTALVQLSPGAGEPTMEAIHEACSTHIARYKLPRRIYYVDFIKRSASGKADYAWAGREAMRLYEAG